MSKLNHPNGRTVVLATDDAVVRVTPVSDRRHQRRQKVPAQSSGSRRSPEEGRRRAEKDVELARWVEETRRQYRSTQPQTLAAHQASLSTQPAPLASLETLASESHLKCGRSSILACLPLSPESMKDSSVASTSKALGDPELMHALEDDSGSLQGHSGVNDRIETRDREVHSSEQRPSGSLVISNRYVSEQSSPNMDQSVESCERGLSDLSLRSHGDSDPECSARGSHRLYTEASPSFQPVVRFKESTNLDQGSPEPRHSHSSSHSRVQNPRQQTDPECAGFRAAHNGSLAKHMSPDPDSDPDTLNPHHYGHRSAEASYSSTDPDPPEYGSISGCQLEGSPRNPNPDSPRSGSHPSGSPATSQHPVPDPDFPQDRFDSDSPSLLGPGSLARSPGTPEPRPAPGPAPPPYSPPTQEDWRLISLDFPPRCINGGGILTTAAFETFDVLVRRANEWLRRHPSARVRSGETIEHRSNLSSPDTVLNTEQPTVPDVDTAGTLTVKSLRLWIEPKPLHDRHLPVQQLGYINVVPACTDPGGVNHRPEFDSQTVTLTKFNTLMRHRPMPGTVLNVETVPMKFRQYSKWVSPDRCHYRQHNDLSTSFLTMFRIYYEVGEPSWEELGYRDFIPSWHNPRSNSATTETGFCDFSRVIAEANRWAQNLPSNVHILNMHTHNAKVKLSRDQRVYVNTERAVHSLYASSTLLQCLRVWYLLPAHTTHQPSSSSSSAPRELTSDLAPSLTPGVTPGIGDDLVNSPFTAGLIAGVMGSGVSGAVNNSRFHDSPHGTPNSSDRSTEGSGLPSPRLNLSCKAFFPLRCSQGGMFEDAQFESMSETKLRMKHWLKTNSHLSVIAAETIKLKLDQSVPFDHQVGQTLFHNRSDGNLSWTYVLRVYLDGEVSRNPPPEYDYEASDAQRKSSTTCALL